MINSCLCSKCGEWHSHITFDENGKSICINCKHKDKGVNKNDTNKDL